MKTAVFVFSSHHGNTRKLAEAVAAQPEVELFDVAKGEKADFSDCDMIGVASGIYAGNFGKPMLKYLEENLPEGKPVKERR